MAPKEEKDKYFQKYLEGQFGAIHQKLDDAISGFNDKYIVLERKVDSIEQVQKWQNQKIWLAMGALAVLGISGGIFATYFKTLNQQQVTAAVREEVPIAVNAALSGYGFEIEK